MDTKKVHIVYLSLGSNLGDKLRNLERCIDLITIHIGDIPGRSGIYKSDAWGFQSDQLFYNMCLEVKTRYRVEDLMEKIFEIENLMGRVRSGGGYTDRIIDIDLLFFNDLVLNSPKIVVPHPRIGVRRFVLEPLAEVNPDLTHPILNRSIAELLEDCQDINPVEPI